MNLYVRYFNQDILAQNVEEVLDFLYSIPEIQVTPEMETDLRTYAESDMPYPKRYKVRPRIYFIVIKTTAETMEEFKSHNKNAENRQEDAAAAAPRDNRNGQKSLSLSETNPGWYRGAIFFKRVVQIPGTGKFQYQDTRFSAYVKAESGQHCYDRIVEHLKNRQDVDLRSQFPSPRGSNFQFEYLGETLPEE